MMAVTRLLILILTVCTTLQATAQEEKDKERECPCCMESGRIFNFMIGDWEISDSTGKLIGTSNIVSQNDSCVLLENWKWVDGTRSGLVVRYINPYNRSWKTLWLDSKGLISEFNTVEDEEKLIMTTEPFKDASGAMVTTVIVLEDLGDGSFKMIWKMSTPVDPKLDIQKWIVAFSGIYTKKEAASQAPVNKDKRAKD